MLINVGVILYFIPYMYMFAALIALQKEAAERHVIRVPGGRVGAYVAGAAGLLVTAVSIVLSFLPAREVDNQMVFVARIIGSVAVILGIGITVFLFNKRRNERKTDHG